jgi:glycopeptide antibiotics resistance protein
MLTELLVGLLIVMLPVTGSSADTKAGYASARAITRVSARAKNLFCFIVLLPFRIIRRSPGRSNNRFILGFVTNPYLLKRDAPRIVP